MTCVDENPLIYLVRARATRTPRRRATEAATSSWEASRDEFDGPAPGPGTTGLVVRDGTALVLNGGGLHLTVGICWNLGIELGRRVGK